MDQDEAGKGEDSAGYSIPLEAMKMSLQQQQTALSNQLDKALQEALGQAKPQALLSEEARR